MFSNKNQPKSSFKYICENCDFYSHKKSNYDDHILTRKHKSTINGNLEININQSNPAPNHCCPNCGKIYKDNSGLWKHKKKCNSNIIEPTQKLDKDELIITLLKQNAELIKGQQDMMIKLTENGINNNTTTTTNSHNKSFNLQFFLNETCKNAMNITDFVDSIKLQLSDLEKVGEIGYVEGISNIIIKNLNALDVTLRPVHCTDKKRETMYIKDENKWEKEDTNNTKLHKMVRKVSNKNIDLISDFKDLHPDWKKSTSRVSEQFDKIIIESMGGIGDNDYEKEERIIKKVAKAVFVDKNL